MRKLLNYYTLKSYDKPITIKEYQLEKK
jgi:hypothetical protein